MDGATNVATVDAKPLLYLSFCPLAIDCLL